MPETAPRRDRGVGGAPLPRYFLVEPPFLPSAAHTTQALGICLTAGGEIVLVSMDGDEWSLPRRDDQAGETLEQTLVREVREEACARVLD